METSILSGAEERKNASDAQAKAAMLSQLKKGNSGKTISENPDDPKYTTSQEEIYCESASNNDPLGGVIGVQN